MKSSLRKFTFGRIVSLMGIMLWAWQNCSAQGYDFTYNNTLNGAEGLNLKMANYCNNVSSISSNFGVTFMPSVGNNLAETYSGNPGIIWTGDMCSGMPSFCGGLKLEIGDYQHYFNMDNVDITGYTDITLRVPLPNPFGTYTAANIIGSFPIEPVLSYVAMPGIVNRSPEFYTFPQVTANLNKLMNYSCAAFDRDGDSLVYRLRPIAPGVTYAQGLSYQNPIPSAPALSIHPQTGMVSFSPTVYIPDNQPYSPVNKYMVGIEVLEYRKLNGVITKMGTTQRNLMITVVNQVNENPLIAAMHNGQPVPGNSVIEVFADMPLNLDVSMSDPNADSTKWLIPGSDHQRTLPNSTFTYQYINRPSASAQLTWTPTSAEIRKEPYYVTFFGKDNHCPYAGFNSKTIGIKVKGLTGLKEFKTEPAAFTAYPNPFTESINFKLNAGVKAQSIQIYNILGQQIDEIQLKTVGLGEQKVQWQNANKYAAGTYVARLISKDKTIQTLKFTKLQ